MATTSNQTSRKRDRDERIDFEYTGREAVPKNVTHVRFHSSVNEVGGYEYDDNYPYNLTEIPGDAYGFKDCTSLREVVLNDGLKKIGESAFQRCFSLERITIPSTITEIDVYAFSRCNNLRELVLNDGLTKIGDGIFNYCSSLESITIPSAVTVIEEYAFNDCSRLREVVIHNEEVQVRGKSFRNCSSLERFKFPSLSTRFENIIQAGQRDIEVKVDDIPAVEWRGGELTIPAIRQLSEDIWGIVELKVQVDEGKLVKVKELIRYYEIKEATTLFELAYWKAKIDDREDSTTPFDRVACRTEVPGPVKDTILQYIGSAEQIIVWQENGSNNSEDIDSESDDSYW